MGTGNSVFSSFVVGIHIDKRPLGTKERTAKLRTSFCRASKPYGLLGAMKPGRLQVKVSISSRRGEARTHTDRQECHQ